MSAPSPTPCSHPALAHQDVSLVLFNGNYSVNGTLSRCSLGRYGLDVSNFQFLPVDVGCPQGGSLT